MHPHSWRKTMTEERNALTDLFAACWSVAWLFAAIVASTVAVVAVAAMAGQ
jgi:hypothetical protein